MAYNTSNMLGVSYTQLFTPSTDLVPFLGGSDPPFALGQISFGSDGTKWVYVQASAIIGQYKWVGIDENFQAAALSQAMLGDGWIVGVAQVAYADNDYGWIAVEGAGQTGAFDASCAADVTLYLSVNTDGVLDDYAYGAKVAGVVLVTTNSYTIAKNIEALMTYPRSDTF